MSEKLSYSKERQIRTVDIANRVNLPKAVLEEINFDKSKHIFIISSRDGEIILKKASININTKDD